MRLLLYPFCLFLLAVLVVSCSKKTLLDDGSVSCDVEKRIALKVDWRQGNPQDEEKELYIEKALTSELSAESAIQVALLNNPNIQAVFEELGIAEADLLEAGLLTNPAFELEVRYPERKRLHTNIEYLITTSLLDLFLIPLRTKIAGIELEQTKQKISNQVLNLAFDVRETFYELVAQKNKVEFLKSISEITSISREITLRQYDVGNVNSLDCQQFEMKCIQAEIELSKSLVEMIRLQEKLIILLGLKENVCLILPSRLDETDIQEFDLLDLETIAVEERLDLKIARYEIDRISATFNTKEAWCYTNLMGGLAGEKEPGGANLIGPGVSGELPIFNFGQAARMRLFAELRQAIERLNALEIQVRSEVRKAYKTLSTYRKIVNDYQNQVLPLQAQISASTEGLYNAMGVGVDQLLENKRLEISAHQSYVENLKKYLVAKVGLDRALGGHLFLLVREQECKQVVFE